MDNFLSSFALEMGVLIFFGLLYYFYQRRKILDYEHHKVPILMNMILETLLVERGDQAHAVFDPVIEALDDYLNHKTTMAPPTALLQQLAKSPSCNSELRSLIQEVMEELK